MFDDLLLEISQREFEVSVARLFEINQRSGNPIGETPFTGTKYYIDEGDHAELQRREVDALLARKRFEWIGPDWAGVLIS